MITKADFKPGAHIKTINSNDPGSFYETAHSFLVINTDFYGTVVMWCDDRFISENTWDDWGTSFVFMYV